MRQYTTKDRKSETHTKSAVVFWLLFLGLIENTKKNADCLSVVLPSLRGVPSRRITISQLATHSFITTYFQYFVCVFCVTLSRFKEAHIILIWHTKTGPVIPSDLLLSSLRRPVGADVAGIWTDVRAHFTTSLNGEWRGWRPVLLLQQRSWWPETCTM